MALLSLVPLLLSLPTAELHPGPDPLPLVHGGFAAPSAWLALWRGEAWVCWEAGVDGCWQRLELAGVVDLATVRAEFVDRSGLILGDRSEITWLIVRGDPQPQTPTWTAIPRQSPRTHDCGPAELLPIADDDALRFVPRPCAEAPGATQLCVHPGRRLRLRPASALHLRVGLELRALDDWRLPELGLTMATGMQLLATVGVGLDPAAWIGQRRERADLQAQARPAVRALPPPRSSGPLAAAERQALRAVICEVWP